MEDNLISFNFSTLSKLPILTHFMIYQLFDNIELVGDTVFDILFGNTDYYEMISTDDFTDVILQKNMSFNV